MAKNKSDTIKILEAIDTLVVPKLENIEKKLEDHDKKFAEHDEQFGDIHNSLTRIELKLDNEIKRNDDQSKKMEVLGGKILKLEKSKA